MSDEPIVTRTQKTRASRFARINNAVLQDSRLSYRARGVLAYILSRPDTFTHSAERLAGSGREGTDSIRAALRELQAFGYADLRRVRSKRGSVVHQWYFNELPSAINPDSLDGGKPRDLKDTVKKPYGKKADGQKGDGKMALLETTEDKRLLETTEEKRQTQPIPEAAELHGGRPRNELFDALAAATDGQSGAPLTAPASRAIGVALAQIRLVSPDLTADEIARRAANYRSHFKTATLTAIALCKHWSRCAEGAEAHHEKRAGWL